MTPANENAIRAACRRCTEEIQQAMRKKPKPNWNETVPPIINKHHKKIEALGVSLLVRRSPRCAMQNPPRYPRSSPLHPQRSHLHRQHGPLSA